MISGRSTIEGIIQELATVQSTPNGVINDSAGFIVSSEFASSIVKNPMAITILTDLYDRMYHTGDWKNTLKIGPEKLKKPIITLFGGANDFQLKDALTQRDMFGGFLGRTYMIAETKRNTINSLARPIKNVLDRDRAADYLKKLTELEGEFKVEEDALDYYDAWYRNIIGEDVDDETGTLLRIGDHVFKIAMLYALTVTPNLLISKHCMEVAVSLAEPLIPSAKRTATGKGKSTLSEQTYQVIQVLMDAPHRRLSREYLLNHYWKDFDALDLDRIVLTLTDANVVRASQEEKGKLYYEITDEAAEQITKFEARKSN